MAVSLDLYKVFYTVARLQSITRAAEELFISLVTLVGAFIILLTIQWKLALVVFAALFLPRVILPQPLVTLWMPAAVVVTLLPLLVSALLDRRTDL